MVPYHLLYPAILVFCAIGVFSLSNSEFDVYLMALFGVLGYVFAKLDCEPAPMLLGFILGPMMEEYLRRAMLLSKRRSDGAAHPPPQCRHAGACGRCALVLLLLREPARKHSRKSKRRPIRFNERKIHGSVQPTRSARPSFIRGLHDEL